MNENLPPAGEIPATVAGGRRKTGTGRNGDARPAYDFRGMTGGELARATGVHREQWLRWVRRNGCPQNADSTFSLPDCIRWLRFTHAGRGRRRQKPIAVIQSLQRKINLLIEQELCQNIDIS